jgi:sodium/potassium-transporting ATPase subunit alpha
MAFATFVIGLSVHKFQHIIEMFVNGFLVVIVANIPQGLPVTTMSMLLIIGRRLAIKKMYVKQLDVADTLGTTTVIACDKRGILTKNDINVSQVWYDGRTITGKYLIKPNCGLMAETWRKAFFKVKTFI